MPKPVPPDDMPGSTHDPKVVSIKTRGKFEPVKIYWDEQEIEPPRGMLVARLLPAVGLSTLVGQSGFYKSFAVLDLQMACILGTEFMGQPISRQGAAIYFAAEAADTLVRRWRALKKAKAKPHFERMGEPMPHFFPIARIIEVPLLTAPDALERLVAICQQVQADLKSLTNLELVQVSVDTLMAASKFKKEQESGEPAAVMQMLDQLAHIMGINVLAVDHMGKDQEKGARGTSAKLAPVYSELSIYGDKDAKTGVMTGTRMVLTKCRTGASGLQTAFHPVEVQLGVDVDGNAVSDLVIAWDGGLVGSSKLARNNKRHSVLLQAFHDVLETHGKPFRAEADWPLVTAVPADSILARFAVLYPPDGQQGAVREQTVKRKFRAAMKDACGQRVLVSYTTENSNSFVWLASADSSGQHGDGYGAVRSPEHDGQQH